MRSNSGTVEHTGWMPIAKKSLLVAGTAVAVVELLRRVGWRLREKRARADFVSADWIADHVSNHGDGYVA